MVADAQIPPGGRMVRCGRCSHAWQCEAPPPAPVGTHAAAPGDDDFMRQVEAAMGDGAVPVTPLKPGFNLPVIARKPMRTTPFKIAAPALAALWLVLAFATYYPSWTHRPVLKDIYAALGVQTTDGLIFSDVTMERVREGSKTKFILSGSIRNHSTATRALPSVRVALRDKTDQAIWGRDYPVNAQLKAGEVYPFRITNVETVFAGNVSSIVVDMGNPLQLLMR